MPCTQIKYVTTLWLFKARLERGLASVWHLCILLLLIGVSGCIRTEPSNTGNQDGEKKAPVSKAAADEYEAVSLLGKKLKRPPLRLDIRKTLEGQLTTAKATFDKNPDSLSHIIWYGRQLACLYRHREAIQIFTYGLRKFPDSYRLFRHRGEHCISLRQFEDAIRDLEKAAFYMRGEPVKLEKNSIPGRLNKPTSTTQFNVWYHMGLAYYLIGDDDKAISAFKKCMELANTDDLLVATTNWMCLAYQKLGNLRAAEKLLGPIRPSMNIVENGAYHKILLMYKGLLKPQALLDQAEINSEQLTTLGYGVAAWYLLNGDTAKGRALLQKVVENDNWASFGYIAAEVELVNQQVTIGAL